MHLMWSRGEPYLHTTTDRKKGCPRQRDSAECTDRVHNPAMKLRNGACAALLAALPLLGCSPRQTPGPWLGAVTTVAAPGGAGSQFPHLAGGDPLPLVLSWLETRPDGSVALQHATWRDGAWGPPGTVASGTDWFVNWADFPSVVPVSASHWLAHWLQQRPGNVYSYDVQVAASSDGGRSWSPAGTPHADRTPTEHGFVSIFADAGRGSAVWLDGRHTGGGEHAHDAGGAGAMTLRGAQLGPDGRVSGTDAEIDARTCDCCQTDAAVTADGPVVVYRDRGADEVRDIALVRLERGQWSAPVTVHADGWRIDACPVNGPAVAARGRSVVVAWFTAPDRPRVRVAFSADAGRTFAAPVEIGAGDALGRVDVVLLDDGRAVVSWLRQGSSGAEIVAQPVDRTATRGPAVVVAGTAVQRASGFPQMALAGDGLLFAWTEAGAQPRLRTAYATLR